MSQPAADVPSVLSCTGRSLAEAKRCSPCCSARSWGCNRPSASGVGAGDDVCMYQYYAADIAALSFHPAARWQHRARRGRLAGQPEPHFPLSGPPWGLHGAPASLVRRPRADTSPSRRGAYATPGDPQSCLREGTREGARVTWHGILPCWHCMSFTKGCPGLPRDGVWKGAATRNSAPRRGPVAGRSHR